MCANKSVVTVLISFAVILSKSLGINGLAEEDFDLKLTEDQSKVLDEFKQLVNPQTPKDYMKEDVYLVRWLKARSWDIKRAETFLMNDLKWRDENNMYTILEEDWSDYEERYRYNLYDAKDKEGKPVLYMHVADWDVRRAIVIGQQDKLLRYVDSAFERLAKLIRELGETNKNVTQADVIVNLAGYNLVQHGCPTCTAVILRGLLSYENHYPGYADKIFLINTPDTFHAFLEAARGVVLNDVTDRSLKMFGTNKKEWLNALLEVIDVDELSVSLGGNKVWEGVDDF